MKRFVLVALLASVVALHGAGDPFAPLLDGKPPEILREVASADPVPANVVVRRVVFRSRRSSEIFAIIAAPKEAGVHPGMLVLHGGGGSAEVDKAIAWAQRGYVAVAPDMPGIADPKKLILTKGEWSNLKYGEGRWVAHPDAGASTLFDAVLAAMKSLYLLKALPDVDPARIGVVGVSWGGYMTTMVCGLAGEDVRAGMALYGCGFMDQGYGRASLGQMNEADRTEWLSYLDAGRRVPKMKAAFFLAAAANDFFGYPDSVQATLDAIPGPRNQVFAPNANHRIPVPGGSVFDNKPATPFVPTAFQPYPTPSGGKANWIAMEVPYFEYHLKAQGQPFPKVSVRGGAGSRVARFVVESPRPVVKAEVYWAKAEVGTPTQEDVKKRVWKALPVRRSDGATYEAELPAEAAVWFALVSDDRPISVSSDLVKLPAEKK